MLRVESRRSVCMKVREMDSMLSCAGCRFDYVSRQVTDPSCGGADPHGEMLKAWLYAGGGL